VCGAVSISTAGAAVSKGVKPDIVLSPDRRSFFGEYTSLLVNDVTPLAGEEAGANVAPTPDQCRDLPPLDVVCDVYRIKIVRDTAKGAQNFVQVLVDWPTQVSTPALALVAAGLSDADLPDIDLFLYENAETYVEYAFVGGRSANVPERIVWEATQDEYDLVIRSGTGIVTEYSINARVSDEVFGKPFEVLEDLVTRTEPPFRPPGDDSVAPAPVASETPPLALAPIDVDDQIAGIGLGVTEHFDPSALDLGPQTRAISAVVKPPSALTLIIAMGLLPLAVAAGAVVALRRRHALIA
jgi:hypothetical protein